MEDILQIAYISARSGENELLQLKLLSVLLKTIFAYSTYIVKVITLLIQSLVNSVNINIYRVSILDEALYYKQLGFQR